MLLHESGQMYLESIYVFLEKGKPVRAIDVGKYLGFSKPSVSRALGILKKGEYINVSENGSITLTEKGYEVASKLYERHTVLTEMLVSLGVDMEIAVEDACKIEHVISDATFDAIKQHMHKYKQ